MRIRKLLAITVVVAAFIALLAMLNWQSRGPFEIKLMGIEPSGILDDAGKEFLLVDIQIINRGMGVLFCRREKQPVEARIAKRWVEVETPWGIGNLTTHGKKPVTALLPAAADGCRITFEYQREPMQISFARKLGTRGQQAVARILPIRVSNWLWPHTIFPRSSSWKPINLEVPLTKKP